MGGHWDLSLFLLHSLPLIYHKGKSCLPKLLYDVLPCHMPKAVDEGLTNSALEISTTVSKANIFFLFKYILGILFCLYKAN